MEITLGLLLLLTSIFLSSTLILRLTRQKRGPRPPGPRGWPIFGNMFDVGTLPHQTFYKLRPKYGSVLWFKFGCVDTLVVQSAKTAAELFKNHDHVFCDRKCPVALTAHNYNQGSMAIGSYGPHWRMIRRLAATQVMVNKRIIETKNVRKKCIDKMIQYIEEDAAAARAQGEAGEVDLSHFLFIMTFNVIGNIFLSCDLVDSKSKEGRQFFDAMGKMVESVSTPNVADFFPILQCLDPQGLKRKAEQSIGVAMEIISKFVEERIEEKKKKLVQEKATKDFLDDILEHQGQGVVDKLTDHNVIIFILEMFLGGTETTSASIEWAMAELLGHPEAMRKAKEELNRVVGKNRRVEENDIEDLPYLQAVMKETLRLHPALPMTLPRNAIEDVDFMGYAIPKDTQIWVNVWAVGRDPDVWEDPLSFKPERFLNSKIDYKGHNYEFIPFGSGRRICVGMSLAHKVIHLALATLLHCFEWELPNNIMPEI